MPRPLRLQYPDALYHVTARGNRREVIFRDDTDRRAFLAIVRDSFLRFDAGMWAYCLMGNHYHFVVQTPDPNLSRVMHRINGMYTQVYNRRHATVGHVFQGRFHSAVVDRDEYLLEACRYVELNPVRAGLVATPEEWPWSSYRAHTGRAPGHAWLRTAQVHGLLCPNGEISPEEGRRRYADLVASAHQVDSTALVSEGDGDLREGKDASLPSLGAQTLEATDVSATRPPAGDDRSDGALLRAHLEYGLSMTELARSRGVSVSTVSRAIRRAIRQHAKPGAPADRPGAPQNPPERSR